ncbi:hypothetical protein [Methylomonas rivi]|uniref:Uncharacterized protein n=1 Tax=Methylomonas rivi TaxID=2952226 RepID=A0ABT1U4U7_9GAMM|nr:hypothetical protein [Methylomonas sp. WSC-6]MBS4049765.1 hypothetical protein [Methylomonas sp.]MCQ8128636.1 hypothetical protein [Methylomonas sp. WSC-6]
MSILLIGAVACMAALILSAWLMTFARWFPIQGIDEKFLVDYKTMIRAHVDYALMALFNLGFYGAGIDLPVFACWCVAIGGFANPTVFVIAAFDPDFWHKTHWKVYTAISFMITTVGFIGVGTALLRQAL